MSTYATLDEALEEIATRSFYESATVTPSTYGTYDVSDDFGTAFPDDVVTWTYEKGIETDADEHAGIMEPCQYFDTAHHVRYYLPAAVEHLEARRGPVTFAYVQVDTVASTAEDIADDEAGLYDGTVGWTILARHHRSSASLSIETFHDQISAANAQYAVDKDPTAYRLEAERARKEWEDALAGAYYDGDVEADLEEALAQGGRVYAPTELGLERVHSTINLYTVRDITGAPVEPLIARMTGPFKVKHATTVPIARA